jgi:hypothetical protein
MPHIEQKEVDILEAIIDRVGLAQLAEAISAIAAGKADHVQTNWADKGLAQTWTRIGRKFDKLIPALELNDELLGFRK